MPCRPPSLSDHAHAPQSNVTSARDTREPTALAGGLLSGDLSSLVCVYSPWVQADMHLALRPVPDGTQFNRGFNDCLSSFKVSKWYLFRSVIVGGPGETLYLNISNIPQSEDGALSLLSPLSRHIAVPDPFLSAVFDSTFMSPPRPTQGPGCWVPWSPVEALSLGDTLLPAEQEPAVLSDTFQWGLTPSDWSWNPQNGFHHRP
ncbi:hypothetical protein TREES_T100021446 [Tupaia chinensis]|uniref:Uncharacterized protein n=1 Tax=Tupaia chinensis TaxID=246437 RepID=L9L2A2_TUPCH|nr:hypothetical protein TREES_T100021446 [Tupaia chinensis]